MQRVVLLALLAVPALPQAAAAHRGTKYQRGFVSTVSAVLPNVLRLSASVLGGDDRLRISNYSGKTVVILGYEHEPYLRFAEGGVFVNTRSPAAYLNRFRFPPAVAPGAADPATEPAWRLVRRGVTFEWHDHRIHWTAQESPPAVQEQPGEQHLIGNWRIPGRVGGKTFEVTGFLGYAAPQQAKANEGGEWVVPAVVGAGAVALSLAGVGAGARRRKRRAH